MERFLRNDLQVTFNSKTLFTEHADKIVNVAAQQLDVIKSRLDLGFDSENTIFVVG